MKPAIFILGYGNPLRGDDGLGWVVAEKLREHWHSSDAVLVDCVHQLTPEIADDLNHCQMAIFIDVTVNGLPGEIHLKQIKADHVYDSPLNHHCSPESLLQLTQQLYGTSPELFVFSITGEEFGYQQSLSRTLEKQIPHLIESINDCIQEYLLN